MKSDNLISKEKVEKNQIKLFKNIKSDYFLEKVFNNLEKKKKLNIVKYNKNVNKRLNVNINDYKEYSEKYSSIEIEIKPIEPINGEYCDFFNIKTREEEDGRYYHIYFNNNEEEEKRNFISKYEEIKIIKIIIDYQVKSFQGLFYKCDCIESINFKKFYRNNINNICSLIVHH